MLRVACRWAQVCPVCRVALFHNTWCPCAGTSHRAKGRARAGNLDFRKRAGRPTSNTRHRARKRKGDRGSMKGDKTPKRYRFSPSTVEWIQGWSRWAPRAMTAYFILPFLPTHGVISMIWISFVVIFLICFYAVMRFTTNIIRDALLNTTYSIESDCLKVNREDIFGELSIDFGAVTGVTVGSARSPQSMRMHIVFGDGKEAIIHTLQEMEKFVSEIEKRVPVDVRYLDEQISPWTKDHKSTAIFISVAFLVPLYCVWFL